MLVAMITATKTTDSTASDAAIFIPSDWQTRRAQKSASPPSKTEADTEGKGHQEVSLPSLHVVVSSPWQSYRFVIFHSLLFQIQNGRTIAIWTLGVLPELQGKGLGKILMRAYQARMSSSGIADRISLTAHEHLFPLYEGLGFQNRGRSPAVYGGGGWSDLVFEFGDPGAGSGAGRGISFG